MGTATIPRSDGTRRLVDRERLCQARALHGRRETARVALHDGVRRRDGRAEQLRRLPLHRHRRRVARQQRVARRRRRRGDRGQVAVRAVRPGGDDKHEQRRQPDDDGGVAAREAPGRQRLGRFRLAARSPAQRAARLLLDHRDTGSRGCRSAWTRRAGRSRPRRRSSAAASSELGGEPSVPSWPRSRSFSNGEVRERPLREIRLEPGLAVPPCHGPADRLPVATPAEAKRDVEREQRHGRDQRDRDPQQNSEPVDRRRRRGSARARARAGGGRLGSELGDPAADERDVPDRRQSVTGRFGRGSRLDDGVAERPQRRHLVRRVDGDGDPEHGPDRERHVEPAHRARREEGGSGRHMPLMPPRSIRNRPGRLRALATERVRVVRHLQDVGAPVADARLLR